MTNHETRALRAVLTVTVETRPDGGHYFDQADFTAHAMQWVKSTLRGQHAVDQVTVVDQAAELARAQAEAHQYRTALEGVARKAAVSVPPPATRADDRAAVLREAADLVAADTGFHIRYGSATDYAEHYAELLRRLAAEAPTTTKPETEPEWARPETEEEKLAKCRRMAKALSAPPVAPPEWATTTEWPGRHKRPGDRRIHATARFVVVNTQQFWTACGKHVGRGGIPLNHMPVDCRDCTRATAAGPHQDGAQS